MIPIIISQYRASLAMLRSAISLTPDALWNDSAYPSRTWRIAYHTLYYTQLYLGASPDAYVPWEKAIDEAEDLDSRAFDEKLIGRDEILGWLDSIVASIPRAVESLPLDAESGFYWLKFTRAELHIYSIRHIMDHTGQLAERLRANGVTSGVKWVSKEGARGLP